MGEIDIHKDENISKIYHANEKNIKKIGQLGTNQVVYKKPMVGTPTSYTQAQSLDERLVQKNISSALAKARRLLYYKLTKNHKIKILAEVDNGFYW